MTRHIRDYSAAKRATSPATVLPAAEASVQAREAVDALVSRYEDRCGTAWLDISLLPQAVSVGIPKQLLASFRD